MTNEMQTQKQEVQSTEGVERTRAMRVFVPSVDIYSEDDGVVIMVDLPGVDENNLDINLEKKVLTINGYITPEDPDDYELTYREFRVGDYQRSFTIPDEIDTDNIEASINNGVLKIMLYKAPEAQTRKISVKAG